MKNIFINERDHFKWGKQKEYISHLDTIDDDTKNKATNALSFLELEFGAHFLKTILASRTNGTFGFARHKNQPFAKPKEPFLPSLKKQITQNPN